MVAVYAIFTIVGAVAIVGWIALGLASSAWQDKEHLDPETRFGERGRTVVAAVLGLGLAGMSASYGGWNAGLALVAALAGAGIGVASSRFLGSESDGESV